MAGERPTVQDRTISSRSRTVVGAVRAAVALCAFLMAVAVAVGAASDLDPAHAAPSSTRFHAVAPARLADTRAPDCTCTVLDGSTIRVQVAGRSAVPTGASAAALTVTVSNTATAGFATVWPAGAPRQETSTLNWGGAQTRANGTLVQLGVAGAVDVYVDGGLAAADVMIDVTGAFVVGAGSDGSGRLRPMPPARLIDTRNGAPVAAGTTLRVPLPAGVPGDATALAVNVTSTDSAGGGYLTAHAAGTPRPATSTVNTDGSGQTRATTAIVPVSAAGLDVFASATTHVLVDVVGWFTGASAPASADGMFVPLAPLRLFDTRRAASPVAGGSAVRMYADSADASGALSSVVPLSGALVFNTTAVATGSGGYVTAFAAQTSVPPTSTLNWQAAETVANLTISPVSAAGVTFTASASTHLVADLTGYFIGTPTTSTAGGPLPIPTAPQDPAVAAIVAAGVPDDVLATLADVELQFLPDGDVPANDTCFGQIGAASTDRWASSLGQPWQITRQRIALAAGLVNACPGTLRPASTGAHEVGHILIARWAYAPQTLAEQSGRVAQIGAFAPGGEECLAEAVGQALFVRKGIGPYEFGYGGELQSCAAAAGPRALAQQVIAFVG